MRSGAQQQPGDDRAEEDGHPGGRGRRQELDGLRCGATPLPVPPPAVESMDQIAEHWRPSAD
jgi:hypothetical protein